ncbi:MAG: RNA polymerase factor sigma-54 [bacterium]
MKDSLRLEQRLGLELRLTPQLILTLKLLPLTALELEVLARRELEENPVLEEAPDAAEPVDIEASPAPADIPAVGSEKLVSETEEGPDVASRETEEFLELLDSEDYHVTPREEYGGPDTDPMELAADEGPGLAAALLPGLRARLDDEGARTAEIVLQSLDQDGFLTVAPDELAATHGLDPVRLDEVLELVRAVEPGGIACRDRREALLTQLRLHGHPADSLEYRVVAEFWERLLEMQFAKIAKLAGTTEEEVRRAAECIHGLEMRPARRFAGRPAEYVSPDFTVFRRDGRLAFEYNDDREPRLRLGRRYVEILRNPSRYSREQVEFARQRYNRAMMFLRAIESRRRTLRRLMQALIDLQPGFFEHGPEHLKPATMADAAALIGVHPSTVSRASTGKYIETEHGIFPVKHFFNAGAGDRSRASIKDIIRGMVESEDPKQALSDEAIESRLRTEHGIELSRRTVTKYRAELGIPGSSRRSRR